MPYRSNSANKTKTTTTKKKSICFISLLRCLFQTTVICSIVWLVTIKQRLQSIQSKNLGVEIGVLPSRHDDETESKLIQKEQASKVEEPLHTDYSKFNYRRAKSRKVYDENHECGLAPNYNEFFQQSDAVRSFRNEDHRIYELFFRSYYNEESDSFRKFSYVELGAFNGVRESNSRFFDVCLQWDGLLIEANPMKYPKLLQTRPNAHCMNYAPSCSEPQKIGFHSVSFTNAAQANVENHYDNTSLVQVPCDSLTPPIMDILGGYVSFFSLDVEGAEAMVLKTVDFTKIHVDVWMVENVNIFCRENCKSRDESHAILINAGYVGYKRVVFGSTIFVKPYSRFWKILEKDFKGDRYQIN